MYKQIHFISKAQLFPKNISNIFTVQYITENPYLSQRSLDSSIARWQFILLDQSI